MPRPQLDEVMHMHCTRPSLAVPRSAASTRYGGSRGGAQHKKDVAPSGRSTERVRRRSDYRTVVERCVDRGIILRGIRDPKGQLLEYEVWVRGLRVGLIGHDTAQSWDDDGDEQTSREWYAVTESCKRLPGPFESGDAAAVALKGEFSW